MIRRLSYGLVLVIATFGCSRSSGEASHRTERASSFNALTAERFEPKGTGAADERVARAKKLFIEQGHAFLPESEVDTFRLSGDLVEATPAAQRFQPVQLRVQIPSLASGHLGVFAGAMHLDVKPRGFADAQLDWADRTATYARVSEGVDAYRVITSDGVEDFYQVADERDELAFSYEVTLGDVAGLRLVAGSLEFLDANGTPRLAAPAPIVLDSRGHSRLGAMHVSGCAYDQRAIGPWGRAVTKPGASTCTVTAKIDGKGLSYPVLVDPAWKGTANTKRSHAFHKLIRLPSGSDNGKVLLVGGTGSEPMLTELFDPATKSWATSAPLPSTLPYGGLGVGMNAVAVSSGHVIAAGGFGISGGTSIAQGVTIVRDPTTGLWKTAATMNARSWHAMVAVTIDGKPAALAIGGQSTTSITSSVPAIKSAEYYFVNGPTVSLDDSWVNAGAMAAGRSKLRADVLGDGRVLAAGGEMYNGSFTEGSANTDIFNPTTKSWAAAANLNTKRNQLELVALAGTGAQAIAAGGSTSTSYSGNQDTLEYFDGATWTTLTAKMSMPRWQFASARLDDGRVLLAGGESYNTTSGILAPTANAELFLPGSTPVTGTITGGGSMSVERKNHALVNIPTLGALATGGLAPSTETTASELFNISIGGACGTGGICPSGLSCVDSVCCESSSCPEGEKCNAPGREGVCTKGNGATCSNNTECASGYCVGGFCCESACAGSCRACDNTGKCNLATAGTVCSGDVICGRRCDAVGTCTFTYAPTGTKCGASATDAGTGTFCTTYGCSGFGSCSTTTNNCGLTCTSSVTCNETSKTCTATASGIKPGFCVIMGSCYAYGDINPDDSCKVCDPPSSKIAWSTAVSCIDGGLDTGFEEDTGEPEDTGTEDTGSVEDTGGEEDTGSTDDASADAAAIELPSASACGCSVPGESSNSAAGALAALGLALALSSRRRR
jgi:MYXO-CTERM domain-containing protein